jgi:pyrroline-5-carboxylate reductase
MTTILLVGCGRMGNAMLTGWLAGGMVTRVFVVEPAGPPVEHALVEWRADAAALPDDLDADVLVVAIKPQAVAKVLPAYRSIVARGALVLSVAAGTSIRTYETLLGGSPAVVRAMPNLPAAIGRGITVCVGNAAVGEAGQGLATRLVGSIGAVEWVADEALMDAVTALSGSGPAYVFLLIEAMAEAGLKAGLPRDLAMRLALATVAGAGELARVSGVTAEALRHGVTSPGGTTAAALDHLMGPSGLQPLLDRAIMAAATRSRQLAG